MSESKTWEMAKGLANIKYFFERWVQWPGLGTVSLHVSRHVSLCSSLFVHASCFSLCSCSLATRQGKTICSPAHVVSLFFLSSFLFSFFHCLEDRAFSEKEFKSTLRIGTFDCRLIVGY